MSERQQYVEYDGCISGPTSVELGVPQGSVLGPTLFIVYINDLADNLIKSHCIMFADDTTIYDHDSNINNLYTNLTNELIILIDWFYANRLSLNLSKTHHMLFTNTKLDNVISCNLKVGNEHIEKVKCVKFLGLKIDSELKWDKHIDVVSKRITSGFYAINKAKSVLNRKCLTSLYYAFVYPHLSYGISLWGNTYNVYLKKLIVLQKKIVRVIMNSEYNAHSEPLFKTLKILKVSDVYKIHVAKYVFSFLKCLLPNVLTDMFQIMGNRNVYYTRQLKTSKLKVPRIRTSLSARSLTNMGPKIWNPIDSKLYLKVTNHIVSFVNMKCFVSRLKKLIIDNYI